ncbi:hypothetical protein MKW92_050886, partial [Papaver armeniacum]
MGLGGSDELNCIDSGRITGGDAWAKCSSLGFESSRSSWSFWSNEAREEENFVCRVRNLEDGTEYVVDELSQDDGVVSLVRETDAAVERRQVERRKRVKKSWLKKLCHLVGVFARRKIGAKVKLPDSDAAPGAKVKRVRVRPLKKRSKEMSALYMGQEIHAHKGSILTMKFSLGWILRVRSIESEILDIDPSCVYFKVNHFFELAPLFNFITFGLCCFSTESYKDFDKPLHEFHGHNSEVLDLSWSNNKVVWQDQCLKIFSHNNYYRRKLLEMSEIVTAVSYRHDGQILLNFYPCSVGIVGTMTGNCHFYNISKHT